MELEQSVVTFVQSLIPLAGLISAAFWKFTHDPRDHFDFRVTRKFEEELQSETNELGEIALQVADLAETDDDRVNIAADHAVAIVMRGAFDDSLPNAGEMFDSIDPDVSDQQESVREELKAFDRARRMYDTCTTLEWLWKVEIAVLLGLFVFTVGAHGIPLLYPEANIPFTGSNAVRDLSFVSLLIVIFTYLTGAVWLFVDQKLEALLHEHDIPADPDPNVSASVSSDADESEPPTPEA